MWIWSWSYHSSFGDIPNSISSLPGNLSVSTVKSLRWMDGLQFYVLFNSVSIISGQWEIDNERLCAMELHLQLRRFRLGGGGIELGPLD